MIQESSGDAYLSDMHRRRLEAVEIKPCRKPHFWDIHTPVDIRENWPCVVNITLDLESTPIYNTPNSRVLTTTPSSLHLSALDGGQGRNSRNRLRRRSTTVKEKVDMDVSGLHAWQWTSQNHMSAHIYHLHWMLVPDRHYYSSIILRALSRVRSRDTLVHGFCLSRDRYPILKRVSYIADSSRYGLKQGQRCFP